MTCSNGDKLERGDFYRNLEAKLGIAQRAKQKKRVKAIHAKIKNRCLRKSTKRTLPKPVRVAAAFLPAVRKVEQDLE